MTNEEAAAMLERMKNYFLPTSPMLEERREITALDLAISALSKQSASSGQDNYKAQVKILAEVLDGSPLNLPCNLMWRPTGWCKEHCGPGQDAPNAECWMRYAMVMTESKTESDTGNRQLDDLPMKLTRYEPEENATANKILIDLAEAIEIVKFECGEWEGLAKTIVNGLKKLSPKQSEKIPYKKPEIIHCESCKHWTHTPMRGYGLGKCDFHDDDLVTRYGSCGSAERRNDG